jgi:type I restriction enzyme M protein
MLDNTTKRRIDDCRDILVGKLPDPKAQTIALIYKFMDDMDKEAIELGGEAKFFSGDYAQYSWDALFSAKVTSVEMLRLYSEAIESMEKNPNIPQLFRDIFNNAYLPYRDPETLKLFLKTIGGFEYTHSEKLGDAFEYLLSVMGSQGDAGQFRTPRHIIDFLVELVDPKKTDTILDPACGTAGFLISAFKYIKEQNNSQLTPDDRKKLIQNLVGYDISPDMVRLSLVNLYLHGFSDPHITEYDTLSSEERWDETFDVVLANPPFMSPKGGIRPHKKFTINSNRSEVLFVDYIAEHLNPNGRAGIIVPEGVIFQSGTAYKDLRKMLVNQSLYAVVSLPAGVFNPYSGVKTSILLMDKALAKKSDQILFIKIDNDGYNLGAQRTAVKGSQLAEAVATLKAFRNSIVEGKAFDKTEMIHAVTKAKIAEGGDYNLSGERYRNKQAINNTNYPIVEIGDVLEFHYGKPLKKEDRVEGEFPVYGSNGIVGWHNEYLVKPPFIVVGRKGSAGALHYSELPGYPIDTTFFVESKKPDKISLKYAYHILGTLKLDKLNVQAGIPGLNRNDAYKLKIPLPPLTIQDEIEAEIEGYQKIIDGAKMVVENYKPQIDIDPEWEMVELETLCTIVRGSSPRPKGDPKYYGGSIPRLMVADITRDGMYTTPIIDSLTEEGAKKSRPMNKGSVILTVSGNPGLPTILAIDACIHDGFAGFRNLSETIEAEYLYFVLLYYKEMHGAQSVGAVFKNLNTDQLRRFMIPLPNLDTQLKIVAAIKEEINLVNSNKQLIQIFEQKIKDRIAKVWGEEKPAVEVAIPVAAPAQGELAF